MKIINVFTNEKGEHGNPHQIVLDEDKKLTTEECQSIARTSGLSEVVFVNNRKTGEVSIYNPTDECPFAGSALIAASAWLQPISNLVTKGVTIPTWQENGMIFISMSESTFPPWNVEQMEKPELIEKLTPEQMHDKEHTLVWSWIDETRGIVRARTFATDWGIPEDEANGSGAMKLAVRLGREVTVIHGKGSVVHARPGKDNNAEVGGWVKATDESTG